MEKLESSGTLIIRVILGIIMLAHGYVKIFVYGFGGVGAAFTNMGIPLAHLLGPLVAVLEFLGGLILVLGFLTRWVSLLFVIEFLVAIFKVHIPQGFFIGKGPDGNFHYGFEFPLLLLFLFISFVITGPGKYSIDYILSKGKKNTN